MPDLKGSPVFAWLAGSFCSRLAAGERIFEDKFASLDHVFVQRRVFRIVDFAPLASGAESVDGELFGQQPAEQSSRVEAIAHRCAERTEQLFDRAPGRRRKFQEAHVLPLDIFDSRGLAANLQQSAGGIDSKSFGVGQRVGKAAAPQTAPVAVVGDDQFARSAGQPTNQLTAVKDIGITHNNRLGAEPRSRGGERHDHIGFSPSFVDEIREAGKINHLGAIATHYRDLVRSTAPERGDLPLNQRPAFELDQTLRTVAAQMPQATAAASCEDHGAHQATLKTRWNRAISAGANGSIRSGCHMIPVVERSACWTALTTPSSATAQTPSGDRDSKAAKR